ncbi:MAG: nucleotide excision repair endonuclease, partial [Spirochaetota bacterium]
IEDASPRMCARIVDPLLGGDGRFEKQGDRWVAVRTVDTEDLPLQEASFVLFAVEGPAGGGAWTAAESADPLAALGRAGAFFRYRGGSMEPVEDLRSLLKDITGNVFVPHDVKSLSLLKKAYRLLSPLPAELLTVSIRNLIARLFPDRSYRRWQDIVEEFSLAGFESGDPASKVRTLASVFELLLDRASGGGVYTVGGLLDLAHPEQEKIDFSRYHFDREFLSLIPMRPGVYLFYDREGVVVYAGKTGNLRSRIRSYFRKAGDERDRKIRESLYRIEYRVLGSDLEAVIEEQKLIDRYAPRFNVQRSIPVRKAEVADTVVVVPAADVRRVKLYFLSNTAPLVEYEHAAGEDERPLLRILGELGAKTGYVFDPLKLLAIMYLKRYGDQLNLVDIGRFASPARVVDAIRFYAQDPGRLEREKIGYRG